MEELNGTAGLDINNITHVKVIDVVGMISGDHIQYDSNGNAINDPYATAFASGGFDLDAIGVIHQGPLGTDEHEGLSFQVYPNPAHSNGIVSVSADIAIEHLVLTSLTGEHISQSKTNSIQLGYLSSGAYLLQIKTASGTHTSRILVR
mgnify:FL=1